MQNCKDVRSWRRYFLTSVASLLIIIDQLGGDHFPHDVYGDLDAYLRLLSKSVSSSTVSFRWKTSSFVDEHSGILRQDAPSIPFSSTGGYSPQMQQVQSRHPPML